MFIRFSPLHCIVRFAHFKRVRQKRVIKKVSTKTSLPKKDKDILANTLTLNIEYGTIKYGECLEYYFWGICFSFFT